MRGRRAALAACACPLGLRWLTVIEMSARHAEDRTLTGTPPALPRTSPQLSERGVSCSTVRTLSVLPREPGISFNTYRATAQLTNYEGVQPLTRTPPVATRIRTRVALDINGEGGRGRGQLCKRVRLLPPHTCEAPDVEFKCSMQIHSKYSSSTATALNLFFSCTPTR